MIRAQQKKKKLRGRSGGSGGGSDGGGSGGGGRMVIEMSSLKGQGGEKKVKTKGSSTGAATSVKDSTIHLDDILLAPMAPIIMPEEQSMSTSETHYDEAQEKYYTHNKVTRNSIWLPEKIESIGSERLDGHFTMMNTMREITMNESVSEDTVEVVIKNDDDDDDSDAL